MTMPRRLLLVLNLQLVAFAAVAQAQRGATPPPADTQAAARQAEVKPPLFAFQVEKPARSVPTNPPPVYPRELRVQNIQGQVMARFVVDTMGLAEMETFTVIRSDDPLFTDAVKKALRDYRFDPAELGGRKVRQLVRMPFVFSISP